MYWDKGYNITSKHPSIYNRNCFMHTGFKCGDCTKNSMIQCDYVCYYHSYEIDILIYTQSELADYLPLFISKSFTASSPLFVQTKYNEVSQIKFYSLFI